MTPLTDWLDAHTEALDQAQDLADEILPRLGDSGLLRIGVPASLGGSGGDVGDAIEAIAGVASRSLTAAFVFWSQRTFIEYLLRSDNTALRPRWLPQLLSGELAGATGLSNAIKYLSQLEPLSIQARAMPHTQESVRWSLQGKLPWITNLRRTGFVAAVAVDHVGGRPSIFAVPHDARGVLRSEDLDLIALRASNTAALSLVDTELDEDLLLARDAGAFLAAVRPGFLGLQCGLSIGLSRRALTSIAGSSAATRAAIADEATALEQELSHLTHRLRDGVAQGTFLAAADSLFELRIALARLAGAAVQIEIQVAGGAGYLRQRGSTARRAREAAFIPIVTPSVVQLKTELARHRSSRAA
jgi:alkylation response protein AidB-like acyl-CoA dehydrogenase